MHSFAKMPTAHHTMRIPRLLDSIESILHDDHTGRLKLCNYARLTYVVRIWLGSNPRISQCLLRESGERMHENTRDQGGKGPTDLETKDWGSPSIPGMFGTPELIYLYEYVTIMVGA